MQITLNENNIHVSVVVDDVKLTAQDSHIIRAKALDFFDTLLAYSDPSQPILEEINFSHTPSTHTLLEIESRDPIRCEAAISEQNAPIHVTCTINPETGDKRVGLKRQELMSAEEAGLDSRGMPWDPEIHAKSKLKKKDGTWKGKKGANLIQIAEKEKVILQDLPPPPPPSGMPTPQSVVEKIPSTFSEMTTFIDRALDTGRIEIVDMIKILNQFDVDNVIKLKGNEALYPQIYQSIYATLGGVI